MSTVTQQENEERRAEGTRSAEGLPRPSAPPSRFRRFAKKNPAVVVSGSLLALIVLIVLIVPFFLPSPIRTDLSEILLPPGAEGHLLGTDQYGRDILSRLVNGGRISLLMGVLVALTSGTVGVALGLISGYFPKTGGVIMRVSDAWMAFPAIVLAMLFSILIGPGIVTELLAIGIMTVPFTARVMRSRTMELSSRSYVEAARVGGMGHFQTIFVHVLPHLLPLMVVQGIITIAATILIDGSLSFLGLGIAPPAPSWGNMIADSRAYIGSNPGMLAFPGLALVIVVYLVNMLGTNLRPLFDPQTRALNDLQRLRTRGYTAR